jgi:hypothetical protein
MNIFLFYIVSSLNQQSLPEIYMIHAVMPNLCFTTRKEDPIAAQFSRLFSLVIHHLTEV